MADGIVTLTSSTFDETIGGSTTAVVVDFWADWCGPCKVITGVLRKIKMDLSDDKLLFAIVRWPSCRC